MFIAAGAHWKYFSASEFSVEAMSSHEVADKVEGNSASTGTPEAAITNDAVELLPNCKTPTAASSAEQVAVVGGSAAPAANTEPEQSAAATTDAIDLKRTSTQFVRDRLQ